LLGVSGGIACYKAVEVLRGLKRAGAEVTVVMTDHAREFVQPLTFQTLSNRPVGTGLFNLDQESRIGHIAMAERAQLALVAPCTANVAAKVRAGLADDLLSTVLLATRAPLYLALAMNDGMLMNAATQDNLRVLEERGVRIIPPEEGFLAEGKHAAGRLADPARIVAAIEAHFGGAAAAPGLERLAGRRILVTAGPTLEDLDPVRYMSNRSTGRMGFALAEAARDAGAKVTLVSGPVALADPVGVSVKHVRSAEQMRAAVMEALPAQDALILAAAVSDYRAKTVSPQKIKREGKASLTIELEANADIAAEVGERRRQGQVLIVFAAESQDLLGNAGKKLEKKRADIVAANDITEPGSGFASGQNRITLLRRSAPDRPIALPLMDKREAARQILAEAAALLAGQAGAAPKP
ncbi:MAG: bifunctional phosphopantothenoylcysteine decarboxylase/phosphopantothenate--cysteine ligase CoaBC, partial [SAR324 cluster bacterium]